MEASIRAKIDKPWFAEFMVGEDAVVGFPGESEQARLKRTKPWRDAKFGLFLHWGPQRSGGEYLIKKAELDAFNPVKFDAEDWVITAKNLGFRYIVITAKHHAGFCMFDSEQTDHDIIDATPFDRDPLKELAEACTKQGMLLGIYYSVWDLHHPDYSKEHGSPDYKKYHQYMLDQSAELLTNYGPLVTLWLDGEWVNSWTVERAKDYRNHLRKLQPNILLVDRIGQRREEDGDYGSSENFTPYTGNFNQPWESCQRFDGKWFDTGSDTSQSLEWALRNLVDTVSQGGNLLMNMGPTAEGLLPPKSVEKLKPLGAWLERYGESIYGAQKGPHHLLDWGNSTLRGKTLYYQIFDWPEDSELVIPGLNVGQNNAGIKSMTFLGDPQKKPLDFKQSESGLDVLVSLPNTPFDSLASVLKVELENEPVVDNVIRPLGKKLRPQIGTPDIPIGSYYLAPGFANIHGKRLHFSLGTGAGAQRENLKGWTEDSDWVEWEFLAEKPGVYQVLVTYSSWMNSGKFMVEVAGKKFEHKVIASKAPVKKSPLMAAFQTVRVGEIQIQETGRYLLTVRAVEIDAKAKQYQQGLMMLREVVLTQ